MRTLAQTTQSGEEGRSFLTRGPRPGSFSPARTRPQQRPGGCPANWTAYACFLLLSKVRSYGSKVVIGGFFAAFWTPITLHNYRQQPRWWMGVGRDPKAPVSRSAPVSVRVSR